MALTLFGNECPVGCEEEVILPALPDNPFCGIVPPASRVISLFLTPIGGTNPFDWTVSPAEAVALTIDNANDDNTLSRWLGGNGTIPDHEAVTRESADFITQTVKRVGTLDFTMDITSQALYDFLNLFRCGNAWRNWYFQYATYGGMLYGNETGILFTSLEIFFPKDNAAEGVETARLVGNWEFIMEPQRSVNPLSTTVISGV